MVYITEQRAIVRLNQQMACNHDAKREKHGETKQNKTKKRGKRLITITSRKFITIISCTQRSLAWVVSAGDRLQRAVNRSRADRARLTEKYWSYDLRQTTEIGRLCGSDRSIMIKWAISLGNWSNFPINSTQHKTMPIINSLFAWIWCFHTNTV